MYFLIITVNNKRLIDLLIKKISKIVIKVDKSNVIRALFASTFIILK